MVAYSVFFRVHKLHTVRCSKFQWSGIWTDLSIEQTLMRAIKSRGGLTGGNLRNQKSGYKVWVSLLDHFSYVDQALHNLQIQNKVKSSGHNVAAIHADMTPSSMKKDFAAFKRAYDWLNITSTWTKNRMSLCLFRLDCSRKMAKTL